MGHGLMGSHHISIDSQPCHTPWHGQVGCTGTRVLASMLDTDSIRRFSTRVPIPAGIPGSYEFGHDFC